MRITAVLLLLPSVGLFPRRTATARRRTVPFDIVISRGHIIDGTGSPWYSGDIGIREGHIASIGVRHRASRRQTIDAHGMVVAPGFIDMLGQSDLSILIDRLRKFTRALPSRSPVRVNRSRRSMSA